MQESLTYDFFLSCIMHPVIWTLTMWSSERSGHESTVPSSQELLPHWSPFVHYNSTTSKANTKKPHTRSSIPAEPHSQSQRPRGCCASLMARAPLALSPPTHARLSLYLLHTTARHHLLQISESDDQLPSSSSLSEKSPPPYSSSNSAVFTWYRNTPPMPPNPRQN